MSGSSSSVVITAANYLPAHLFGEFEMWFSNIKVITIIGFFIFGICVNTGGVGDRIYWLPLLV